MLHDPLPEDKPEIAPRCPWCRRAYFAPHLSALLDYFVVIEEAATLGRRALENVACPQDLADEESQQQRPWPEPGA